MLSDEIAKSFKDRVEELVTSGATTSHSTTEEEKKEEVPAVELTLEENQKWFSEVFDVDASQLLSMGLPDIPVDTFHHMHRGWTGDAEWVANSVPAIDPHYIFPVKELHALMAGILYGRAMQIIGDPSAGKTSLAEQIAARSGRPFMLQSMFEELVRDDYLYTIDLRDGETVLTVRPWLKSFEYPFITVADEGHRTPRSQQLAMNHVLNQGGYYCLPDGNNIYPHPQWKFCLTDNTYGWGDGADMYASFVCDMSSKTRIDVSVTVEQLPPSKQMDLLLSKVPGLDSSHADAMIQLGQRITEAFKAGHLPMPWTHRTAESCGRMCLLYKNPIKAVEFGYLEFLSEETERRLMNEFIIELGLNTRYGTFS